ncbi:hypothetical protein Pelo_11644 [Pelomyxa schiedti]|nr:hypothetical protein Pelo_11644 [Pelomyxa schiedti]
MCDIVSRRLSIGILGFTVTAVGDGVSGIRPLNGSSATAPRRDNCIDLAISDAGLPTSILPPSTGNPGNRILWRNSVAFRGLDVAEAVPLFANSVDSVDGESVVLPCERLV